LLNRFEKLLIAEIPSLRRYARALCRDPALADDLPQECRERAGPASGSTCPAATSRTTECRITSLGILSCGKPMQYAG
jgi:hypothetical protein